MKTTLLSFLYLLFFVQALFAQKTYFINESEGKTYTLAESLENHQTNGAAIAIFRNYELDTLIYLGYGDLENQQKVTSSTLFQMGSMTTALTKFAILQLVNEGRIELDAPANNYLKSWKIPTKKFTKNKPVTIRDLLLKTRGFNAVYKPKGYKTGADLPSWEQIMAGDSPSNIPNLNLTKDKASNKTSSIGGDLILQRLLEDVHGKNFTAIIQTEVFDPLQMTHSVIASELSAENKTHAAVGYLENGDRIEGDRQIYPELSVAGLWSTPFDYAKFINHIFKAANGMDNTLLSKSLAQSGIEATNDYISLILLQNEDGNSYWGGAPKGFYNQFAGNAKEGWTVVSCANRELAWQLVNWNLNPRAKEYAQRSE